ncbi:MAG: hypothetical protein P8Y39_09970 [Nitrospirota bacterium]
MEIQDAQVLLRYVPLEELEKLTREATEVHWDRRNRKVEKLNAREAARLLGRRAVRGWRGITLEGEAYPYSPEHCDFLMTRWLEFTKFVGEASLDLRGLVEAEAAERRKNSALTSGRAGTTRA